MFADPQIVTINSVAKSMPKIETSGKKTIYQTNDQLFTLTISHINQGSDRVRSMVRVDQRAIVPDPLTSVNDWETISSYLVIDRPLQGFSVTQVQQLVAGFQSFLDSTAISKIFGQES